MTPLDPIEAHGLSIQVRLVGSLTWSSSSAWATTEQPARSARRRPRLRIHAFHILGAVNKALKLLKGGQDAARAQPRCFGQAFSIQMM